MEVITEAFDWKTLEPGSPGYFERVLLEINALRSEWEMSPLDVLPKGERRADFRYCVLGHAFDGNVLLARRAVRRGIDGEDASIEPEGRPYRKCTTIVADYENRFELGEFPQLELH